VLQRTRHTFLGGFWVGVCVASDAGQSHCPSSLAAGIERSRSVLFDLVESSARSTGHNTFIDEAIS